MANKKSTDAKESIKKQPVSEKTVKAFAIRKCQVVDPSGYKRIYHPGGVDEDGEDVKAQVFDVMESAFSVKNHQAVDKRVQVRMNAAAQVKKEKIEAAQAAVRAKRQEAADALRSANFNIAAL